jgi:hypothetical protein
MVSCLASAVAWNSRRRGEDRGSFKQAGNINGKTRATKHFSFHFPLAIFILATTCVALSLSLQARYELKIVEVFA